MPIVYILALLFAVVSLSALIWYVYETIKKESEAHLDRTELRILVSVLIVSIIAFGVLFVLIVGIEIGIVFLLGLIVLALTIAYIHMKRWTQRKARPKYILDWKYYLAVGLLLIALGVVSFESLHESYLPSPGLEGAGIFYLIVCGFVGIGMLTVWLTLVSIRPAQLK